jgi:transcriptional regulator with XRE-family HTH domain
MNIGAKLRELREARGLTQDQLAERSGVPAGTVRNYEQGRREPSWQALWGLAEALGIGRGPLYDAFRPCLGQEADRRRGPGRPPKAKPGGTAARPSTKGRGRGPRGKAP